MMKHLQLLTLLLFTTLISLSTQAQCEAVATVTDGPGFSVCDATTMSIEPIVTTPASGGDVFEYLVTIDLYPDTSQWDEDILFITDGSIPQSFLDTITQDVNLCFSAMTYSQAELDIITNNPVIQSILQNPPCIVGGQSLSDALFCIKDNVGLATIRGAVDSVLSIIVPNLVPEFLATTGNPPPCFAVAPEGTEYCITIQPDCSLMTSSRDFYNNDAFETFNFPNPFTDFTTVNFHSESPVSLEFNVYNLLGNVVHNEIIDANEGNNVIEFNGSNLNEGVYIYTIGNALNATPHRMVISR